MVLNNGGITQVATSIKDDYPYVAIGTGTTAVNAADTTLETEVMRVASTNTLTTTAVTNDTAQESATFNITTTYAITKSGVFTAASSGTMLCEALFSAINVVNGDTLTVIWKEQVS